MASMIPSRDFGIPRSTIREHNPGGRFRADDVGRGPRGGGQHRPVGPVDLDQRHALSGDRLADRRPPLRLRGLHAPDRPKPPPRRSPPTTPANWRPNLREHHAESRAHFHDSAGRGRAVGAAQGWEYGWRLTGCVGRRCLPGDEGVQLHAVELGGEVAPGVTQAISTVRISGDASRDSCTWAMMRSSVRW
jgi:hypothetical protein